MAKYLSDNKSSVLIFIAIKKPITPDKPPSLSGVIFFIILPACFGWHTWSWARLQAQKGTSKAYYYYFDQHPHYPEDSPQYGQESPHGQDVAYVFMHLDPENPQTTESDLALSETIGTYWTNFAKYGNPNGDGVPEWPAFSDEYPEVMYLTGPEPFIGPVPSVASLEVLDSYFRWRRSPEGEAWAK